MPSIRPIRDPSGGGGLRQLTPQEEIVHALLNGIPYPHDGFDLRFVAKALGVSSQRVGQIQNKVFRKMRKQLGGWE